MPNHSDAKRADYRQKVEAIVRGAGVEPREEILGLVTEYLLDQGWQYECINAYVTYMFYDAMAYAVPFGLYENTGVQRARDTIVVSS